MPPPGAGSVTCGCGHSFRQQLSALPARAVQRPSRRSHGLIGTGYEAGPGRRAVRGPGAVACPVRVPAPFPDHAGKLAHSGVTVVPSPPWWPRAYRHPRASTKSRYGANARFTASATRPWSSRLYPCRGSWRRCLSCSTSQFFMRSTAAGPRGQPNRA